MAINFEVQLSIRGKWREGKWLVEAKDEYGLAGHSGPRDSAEAGVKRAVTSYLGKARGKLV